MMKKINFFIVLTLLFVCEIFISCKDITNSASTNYYYNIGDLILNDGSVVSYKESAIYTNEQKAKAIAVIFKQQKGANKALGVGLKQPDGLQWAKENSIGYITNFKAIQCTPYKDGKESFGVWDSSKTWKGDIKGKDNWKEICKVDKKDTNNPAENYPAFNYALTYAQTAKITGIYSRDWFLPSMPELIELWKNKAVINKVLTALGSENAQILKDGWYWSSSQDDNTATEALDCNFSSGIIDDYNKNTTANGYVCVVREF